MNVEEEKEWNEDSLGPDILRSEVVEAIDRIKLNKAAGVDGVPGEFGSAWVKIV